jgi:hypothetical protein
LLWRRGRRQDHHNPGRRDASHDAPRQQFTVSKKFNVQRAIKQFAGSLRPRVISESIVNSGGK